MNGLIARATALTTVALALIAAATVYVTSRPDLVRGGNEVAAVFEDAYPLLEGMHVRVDGAVAGTVKEIELGDDGNAHITMQMFEGTRMARRDAVASIRQEDITGDSYVSLTLGDHPDPLGDSAIAAARTLSAPRFDDLLNSFNEPTRRGLELLFVELGLTLEGRGEDLNEAALKLRPALAAGNRAISEASSQNSALRSLVSDAERVTAQAADRSDDLGNLVGSLSATLETTADRTEPLDRGLELAPETLTRAKGTMARLARLVDEARPVAATLRAAAPQLADSADLLPSFLDDARLILDDVEPTLSLVSRLLRASLPTLKTNPKRVFTAPFDLTAGLGGVLDTLIGDPTLTKALFGAECYGGRVCDPKRDVGLGSVGVEKRPTSGYPGYDPERFFIRAVAVPTCESFGVPIEPGCFAELPAAACNVLGVVLGDFCPGATARHVRGGPKLGGPGMEPGRAAQPVAPSRRGPSDPAPTDVNQSDLDRLLDFLLGP